MHPRLLGTLLIIACLLVAGCTTNSGTENGLNTTGAPTASPTLPTPTQNPVIVPTPPLTTPPTAAPTIPPDWTPPYLPPTTAVPTTIPAPTTPGTGTLVIDLDILNTEVRVFMAPVEDDISTMLLNARYDLFITYYYGESPLTIEDIVPGEYDLLLVAEELIYTKEITVYPGFYMEIRNLVGFQPFTEFQPIMATPTPTPTPTPLPTLDPSKLRTLPTPTPTPTPTHTLLPLPGVTRTRIV